jgi:DnaJ family protein B protein 12
MSGILTSLLPLILLFGLPLLSSFLSGGTSSGPSFRMDAAKPPHTKKWISRDHKIPYWVDPSEVSDISRRGREQLDHRVEVRLVTELNHQCAAEKQRQEDLMMEAQGWFFRDEDKMEKARRMELKACNRLNALHRGGRS